jgi:hypothetical protein
VIGKAGRRFIDLVVLGFAAYAFAFVPLGRRTALEHARAICATPEASDAQEELQEAGGRLVEQFRGDDLKPQRRFRGKPSVPALAPPSKSRKDEP